MPCRPFPRLALAPSLRGTHAPLRPGALAVRLRFLAPIGETSKRDADGRRTGDYLGQFGIGLLSCFVVSDEIVVVTRSARENHPAVEWRGQADGTYSVRVLDADLAPGTQVYLNCRPGREE